MNFSYINNSPVPVQNGVGKSNTNLPIHPVYKEDGTYFNVLRNARAGIDLFTTNIKNRSFIASWYIRYQIANGLDFRTEYGLNSISSNQRLIVMADYVNLVKHKHLLQLQRGILGTGKTYLIIEKGLVITISMF